MPIPARVALTLLTLVLFSGCDSGRLDCPPSILPDPTPGNTATIPAPRGPETDALATDWVADHDRYVQDAAHDDIELLFLGDSITNGWGYAGTEVWKRRYSRRKAAHFGMSGEQTQNLLWRLQNGELDGVAPAAIVLLIGTNNIYANTPAEIARGVAANLQEIRTRCPHARVLLMGIFPRSQNPTDPERAKIRAVNEMLSAFADCAITYLDIGDHLLNPDGTLRDELMPDYLHPSRKGYEVWADAIAPWVSETLRGR